MKILVCTDFSQASAAGERYAADRFPDADLIVFHAIDTRLVDVIEGLTTRGGDEVKKGMAGYADARMNEIVEARKAQGRRALADLAEGDPVESALASAARHGAELIVAGIAPAVALGRFRTLLCRASRIPVLLVPSDQQPAGENGCGPHLGRRSSVKYESIRLPRSYELGLLAHFPRRLLVPRHGGDDRFTQTKTPLIVIVIVATITTIDRAREKSSTAAGRY